MRRPENAAGEPLPWPLALTAVSVLLQIAVVGLLAWAMFS